MKILFFNWRDITHPLAGGCEVNLHELGKRIVEKGNEVTLVCGEYKGCKKREIIDGIEIIRRGGKYTVYICAFLEYIRSLRKRNYDVIIDEINGVPFFTSLYTKKPVIAFVHHVTKNIFFRELPFMFALIGYVIERLIPLFYRRSIFITVSNSSKEELIEIGVPEDKIKVIHNGISNTYNPDWSKKSSFPHILYLGRLKKYKRLDHLIRAMKLVKKEVEDAKLSIAGSGDVEEELKKMVEELNLSNHVEFYGYVNEEKKKDLLQSAWVFVTPSQKEGWGLTVIEANACGTPAIAYDVPGLKDSIRNGETGLLVANGDIHKLAESIIRVLKDEKLREKLSKNALNWSKNFSWDESSERFLEILKLVKGGADA